MFSSSIRRVALKAQSAPIASIPGAAPRRVASQALSYGCHQRRFSSSKTSSSKPPIPTDGSKGITENQAVSKPPSRTKSEGERSGGKKRKAGEVAANSTVKGRDESILHLPSVPSTHHIDPKQIATASFFAIYRPISLTHTWPKVISDEEFASIFTDRPKRVRKQSEILDTLSATVNQLDAVTGQMEMIKLERRRTSEWNPETDEIRATIPPDSLRKAAVQHLDSTPEETGLRLERLIISGDYRPFQPPPVPAPMHNIEFLKAGADAAKDSEPLHRVYTAVITVEESTHANGDITYMAHSSPLVEQPTPGAPAFRERMRSRHIRYQEKRHEKFGMLDEKNEMLAISVKRIRKLKMKKHKYKKLMRRTRNLRRRLDRN